MGKTAQVQEFEKRFGTLEGELSGSRARLEETEDIIRREVGRAAPELKERLALRVIQVPVFHSLTLSVLVEAKERCEVADIENALQGKRLRILGRDEAAAAAVEVSGQDEILVGPVLRDAGRPSAFWLWAAADNLRLTSSTAVDIAEELLE